MTIELDSTLAQAEVLFLSFAQLVADMERRQAEQSSGTLDTSGLRRRVAPPDGTTQVQISMPELSDNLKELLKSGR
jgi:hypothetical protein